jgi:hypothetical protein
MSSFHEILRRKKAAAEAISNAKDKKLSESAIAEAPLVMSDGDILDTIWKKVKPELQKDMSKGKLEVVNNLARIGKFKVTKDGQAKGKSFRYDLKK